jgi:ATP-dependent Clp protease protease subunit
MNKNYGECGNESGYNNPFDSILLEARYVLLYDEICSESAREITTKLLALAIKNPKKPIFLEINSPGGSVADGIAIMNTIQTLPCPIITIINGEACSMAGFISVVADKRMITPTSFWMGHPLQDIVGGTPQTIKDRGLYLEKLETDLQNIFKNKTKLNAEEFQKMLRGELWLNPAECLSKGIVDEVIEIGQRFLKTPKSKKSRKK